MTFVQVIELSTSRVDELNGLLDAWLSATHGERTATRLVVARDLGDLSRLLLVVEFPSREAAQRNSDLPDTERVFRRLVALCEDVPRFTDLEVLRDVRENKTVVRRYLDEVINAGALGVADELCAPDFREHDPASVNEPLDLADSKASVARWLATLRPSFLIEDQLADGDLVTTRFTVTGTHSGEFMGLGPTGRPVRVTGQVTHRFEDGLLAEAWWNWDQLGLLSQLGVVAL
ncbi:ester cyclase [Streptomyces profundus]|uniref:ester cyclase n=1 Tax=Streptomyces profundus TaxID=2867410 RepID=UPI001D16A844|nr:ester cyclase [Streptomyces sp. MA3_2.13]